MNYFHQTLIRKLKHHLQFLPISLSAYADNNTLSSGKFISLLDFYKVYILQSAKKRISRRFTKFQIIIMSNFAKSQNTEIANHTTYGGSYFQ